MFIQLIYNIRLSSDQQFYMIGRTQLPQLGNCKFFQLGMKYKNFQLQLLTETYNRPTLPAFASSSKFTSFVSSFGFLVAAPPAAA